MKLSVGLGTVLYGIPNDGRSSSMCQEEKLASTRSVEVRGYALLQAVKQRRKQWDKMVDQHVVFSLVDNSTVSGTFIGIDMDETEILVQELETPLGKVAVTRLRGEDVKTVTLSEIE